MLESFANPKLLVILSVLNIPVYYYFGTLFYKTWDDFTEGLRYLFQPGWLSAIRGEFVDDFWESLKIYGYFLMCGAVVALEYKVFS